MVLAGEGLAVEDDLEPVVFRRVVAAGHHHPGVGVEEMGGEIEHRGGDHADVQHVPAAVLQPAAEGRGQGLAGGTAVPRHDHALLSAVVGLAADGPTELIDHLRRQLLD
jgi:hypothetical protein